jgi:hypothetical protein
MDDTLSSPNYQANLTLSKQAGRLRDARALSIRWKQPAAELVLDTFSSVGPKAPTLH